MPDEARLMEVRVKMAADEYGEVGFTSDHRKCLITLAANFSSLERSVERRLSSLETERAHKDDLNRIERELRSALAEKADRDQIPTQTVQQLEHAVNRLNAKVTWAYAFGAGGAMAASALTYLIAEVFHLHLG